MVTEQDIHRLQCESEKIITDTRKYYNSQSSPPEGKQFNQKDVEMLFKDVLMKIDDINDVIFKTTSDYKVDLVHHIETLAVSGFTETHEKYCKNSSPKALLEDKKKSYHDLFVIKMGQGDAAAKFCETVLKNLVLKNIEEQLSCTELLHNLRVHCGEMFRDIKSIQASIMVDMFAKKKFKKYEQYIANYTTCVKGKMSIESVRYFGKENRLKALAQIKLDEVISKVQEALNTTVKSLTGNKHLIKTFFSKIENLKISHNEAAAYLELDVTDRKQFGDIIRQQLQGRVKEDITQTINSWNVAKKLEEKGLADFLFTEVVGCHSRCPFCQVPCDSHSGGKSQGNHSASLHRPQELGGYMSMKTEKLVSEDCCAAIASNVSFRHGEHFEYCTPYKKYHKVYPDWTIHGNADPDVEKYWKWVFAQYNARFARYYSAKKADIPREWFLYETLDIVKDIQDNYHVKVDISKLK